MCCSYLWVNFFHPCSVACSLGLSKHSPCGSSLEHHWRRIVSSVAWFTSTIRGGPGFSPVPAKLVCQIVAGKFVEHQELFPSNIVLTEPDPQLLFDKRLVLTSPPKKPEQRIEDISTWLEAFPIYCLILVSYFPHCRKDLLQYQLLILCIFHQFSRQVWLSYDRAFRENAAATNLTDWSQLSPRFFRWPTRAPQFCFVSDYMQILEPGSLCGPFSILPFCAQVC